MKQVMICGVDCRQGDANCNGYCTGKADSPPAATAASTKAREDLADLMERHLIELRGKERLLMVDALGEPRTRYVRVTLGGAHCVMGATEGDRYVADARAAGDESTYEVADVYLSEREFDDLPEFDGF